MGLLSTGPAAAQGLDAAKPARIGIDSVVLVCSVLEGRMKPRSYTHERLE